MYKVVGWATSSAVSGVVDVSDTCTASSNRALARLATSFSSNCIPFSTIQAFITSLRSLSSIRPSSVKHELQTKSDCLVISLGHNQAFGEHRPKHSSNLLEIFCVIGKLLKLNCKKSRGLKTRKTYHLSRKL